MNFKTIMSAEGGDRGVIPKSAAGPTNSFRVLRNGSNEDAEN